VKPAPFDYSAPRSVSEALDLLVDRDQAVALAGGQSLVPMLNFRLARPAMVVDLNRIDELEYLVGEGRTLLRLGALTRQVSLERSEIVLRHWPLLAQAVRWVGHPAIRARGTVGGSAAHADPRAELPAALLALDASMVCRSHEGERTVAAHEFFRGPMTTALRPGELLCEIVIPPAPAGARTAFAEHARTHGDFAVAGAAVVVVPGRHAAVALIGAGPGPVRAPAAEQALAEGAPPDEVGALAGESAGGGGHRRALVAAVVKRAVQAALAQAVPA
jgi:CO/xanthine dehydrogenase FAD-binding subunit